MSKQILIFLVSAIACATTPAFGMWDCENGWAAVHSKALDDMGDLSPEERIKYFQQLAGYKQPQAPAKPFPQPSPVVKPIQELLASQTERSFNGVLLIAKGDQILFETAQGAYGSPKLESQFPIASLSKQITAATVLRAVQTGKLDLHSPLITYLPEMTDAWAEKVTPHHLLNHTSGIKKLGEPLEFEPGSKFSYSNLGYDLLGKILANVAHSYDYWVELTFGTAKMRNSGAPEDVTIKGDLEVQFPHFIKGYVENENGQITEGNHTWDVSSNPSGGLISTAHDLLKWNLALHEGMTKAIYDQLMNKKTYEQMMTPTIDREHRWGDKVRYAYGVNVNMEDNLLEIAHNGILQDSGYLSTLNYYPASRVSLIILENKVLQTKKYELEDQKKIFYLHDEIRKIVRNTLMQ